MFIRMSEILSDDFLYQKWGQWDLFGPKNYIVEHLIRFSQIVADDRHERARKIGSFGFLMNILSMLDGVNEPKMNNNLNFPLSLII